MDGLSTWKGVDIVRANPGRLEKGGPPTAAVSMRWRLELGWKERVRVKGDCRFEGIMVQSRVNMLAEWDQEMDGMQRGWIRACE